LYIAGRVYHLCRGKAETVQEAEASTSAIQAVAFAPLSQVERDPIAQDAEAVERMTSKPVHKRTAAAINAILNKQDAYLMVSDPLHFSEIVIAPTMFLDHLPSNYEAAFAQARATFLKNTEQNELSNSR
jgi:hypothetical protein